MRTDTWHLAVAEPRWYSLASFVVSFGLGVGSSLLAAEVPRDSVLWWLIVSGPLLAGVSLILSPWFRRLLPPLWASPSQEILHKAKPCKGLVVLVSSGPGSGSAAAAIRHHAPTLEKVWLVHSDTSRPDAEKLIEDLSCEKTFRADQFELIALSDGYFEDPEVVRNLIEAKVYKRLPEGLKEDDILIDITGGRKTTTAGAFLAGLLPGRRLEIIDPKKVDSRHRGLIPGSPLEIRIHYRLKRARPR